MADRVARYCGVGLALAYPVSAHLAIARHSLRLTLIAMALLAAAMLVPAMIRGRLGAWLALPVAVGCLWLLSRWNTDVLPLYAPPVLVPAFMAWVFGHTLTGRQTPLIARLVSLLHAPGDEIDADVWPYARRLTLAWALLLAALATTNLVLAALVVPDGLLMAANITPPLAVAPELWSLFANLLGYLLVAAFFLIEYAYRRRRFPQQPYRNFFDFLARTIAASPRLLEPGLLETGQATPAGRLPGE
jgi:uncharacterized membrane protein